MPARVLPAPLRPRPAMPFVGRDEEIGGLLSTLARSAEDGRQVALVGGEPGAGKTRLARELAERTAAAGGLVLYGSCDPAVRMPYQPLVEALEHAMEDCAPGTLEAAAGARTAELSRLLPELERPASGPTRVAAGDPDAERHQLHMALGALLAGLAKTQPVLLILDDLHWADAASLTALAHLARRLGGAPVVILALFREGEAELHQELRATLSALHRLDGVIRLRLTGLEVRAIERLVLLSSESAPESAAGLAAELAALTDGNAFLLGEVWRRLRDGADTTSRDVVAGAVVPHSVREVLRHRLSGVASSTLGVLELISLSARGLELSVLRAAAQLADQALTRALEEGLGAGVIEEVPDVRIVYRFRHELLRRTVHEGLSSLRRAQLHLGVAEALEAAPGGPGERDVGDLAMHYRAATPVAGPERAVLYAMRAAAVAERSLAFDEAARQLKLGLELGIADPASDAAARCRLGMALHFAGHASEALDAFAEAARLAREHGDRELLARAAIGFETACWRPGLSDPRTVPMLTAAVGAAESEGARRVRLLAHLSRALAYQGDHRRAGARWVEAVDLARRLDDPALLAMALSHAAWTRGSHDLGEVLSAMTEARDLAERLPNDDLIDVIRGMRVGLLVEDFEMEEARREVSAHRALAERAGQPFLSHVVAYMASTIALCDGRLDAAEALAGRAADVARTFEQGPSAIHGIQMFSIRREQGRLAEVAPVVRLVAAGHGDTNVIWGPALAVLLAEIGDSDAAREALARLDPEEVVDRSEGNLRLGGLAYLADTCCLVGDAACAAPIYDALRRLEGRNLVIGSAVACYGAADRHLGALSTTMREWTAAERHLDAALQLNERLQSPTWIAHTRYEQGRMLLARGRAADRSAAAEILASALAGARRIGLHALAGRIDLLRARAAPAPAVDDVSPREAQVLRLLSAGLSNRAIAGTLRVSEHTVANHLRSIYRKTGCANRTQAAAYALRRGFADA